MLRRRPIVLVLALAALLALPATATAQFPGRPGRFVSAVGGLTTFARDGSDPQILDLGAKLEGQSTSYPSWTPSGKAIVFDASALGGDYEIFRFTLGAARAIRLTDNATDDWGAHQGPDRIVFVCERASSAEICTMRLDGSGVRRLTDNDDEDWNPKWSPDGSRIVFSSDRRGDHDIFSMKADGTGLRRLTDQAGDDLEPDFAPDGTRIVFWNNLISGGTLYLVDPDGSNLDIIAWGPEGGPAPASTRVPTWSPNGTKIAFGAGGSLWVTSVAGGDAAPVIGSGIDSNIGWQPRP